MQIAFHSQMPELQIDEREGQMLASAGANVARWYAPLDMERDTKTAAWFALAVVAIMTYGPRAMAVRRRLQNEAAQAHAYAAGVQAGAAAPQDDERMHLQ